VNVNPCFVKYAYSLVFEGCNILQMLCHYPPEQVFKAPGSWGSKDFM